MSGFDRPRPGQCEVVRPRDRVAVARLLGDHDLGTAPELQELLYSLVDTNDLVVVDLSETTFVDSTVLRNVVSAQRHARKAGRRFRLQLPASGIVYRLFEVSGLLGVLDVAETREVAIALAC
jgi:anti-sigma B factor antagonist